MSEIKNVLLVGASGNIGSYILSALLAANFSVTILTRSDSTSSFPPNVRVIRADYTSSSALQAAFAGQDVVVSAVGPGGTLTQLAMIDAAVAVGVKRFIPSEFGPPHAQARLAELEFAAAPRKTVFKHLQEAAQRSAAVAGGEVFTYSALATGLPFEFALKKYPTGVGIDIPARSAYIVDAGNEPITATCMHAIAQGIVGILQRPAETANRFLRIRSMEVTQNALVAAAEAVMGKSFAVTRVSSRELLAAGKAKLEAGEKGAMLDLVTVQLWQEGAGRGVVVTREEADNELLGVKEEDIVDILGRVVKEEQMI